MIGDQQRAGRVGGAPDRQSVRSSIRIHSRCSDTPASVGASMRVSS